MSTELIEREQQASTGLIEVAASRQAQEVQAMMVIAKKCPRDEIDATTRITNACKRKGLAECAIYSYPKGGKKITGPSIRLAETLARCWGNLDFGITELEQRNGESVVVAYCWDVETNTRQTKTFTVKHERHTKQGITRLSDPRDVYEMVANQGARRLRACILGIIPGDIQDLAVEQCRKTLTGNGAVPLVDRVRKMVSTFDAIGVTQDMLETRLGHKVEACNEQDLVNLREIFTSMKDGMSNREQWFDIATDKPTTLDDVADKLDETAKPEAAKQEAVAPTTDNPDEPSGDELWLMTLQLTVDEIDTISAVNEKRREAIDSHQQLQPAIDDIMDARINKIRSSRGSKDK